MTELVKLHEAIYKLNPSVVTLRGLVAYDIDENIVEYDLSAAEAEAAKETNL